MATVYRRKEKRPIPDGAEIITYRGKPYATWTDAKGKAQRAALAADGKHVIQLATCYTAQYFDENGKRRKAPTECQDKAEALRYANHLENQARKRRTGECDMKAERYGKEARRPLSDHVADFKPMVNRPKFCGGRCGGSTDAKRCQKLRIVANGPKIAGATATRHKSCLWQDFAIRRETPRQW
jgi:hypothetical protein